MPPVSRSSLVGTQRFADRAWDGRNGRKVKDHVDTTEQVGHIVSREVTLRDLSTHDQRRIALDALLQELS